MKLAKSGAQIAYDERGFALLRPTRQKARTEAAFAKICSDFGVGEDLVLDVGHREIDGSHFDNEDRIKRAVALLNALMAM